MYLDDLLLEIMLLNDKVYQEYAKSDDAEITADGYRAPRAETNLLKEAWHNLGKAERALRDAQTAACYK